MPLEPPLAHGPRFEAMMAEVDAKLTSEGVDISARSFLAVREISMKYGVSIPLGGDPTRMPPDLRRGAALGDAINRWYTENYGDRLKSDPCAGRAAVLLDGDLYVVRVPRIFGSVDFTIERGWRDNPGISRGPVTCNVVQLVDGMTPAKALRLSDDSLHALAATFEMAVPALYTLESTHHELMSIAHGDVEVAVASLIARPGRFGASKWSSLQAAEKAFKAAIDLAGNAFKTTHELKVLAAMLADTGLSFDANAQIEAIQCEPAIRYEQGSCSRDEALAAHLASLQLVNILREAGAKFELGIGGFDSSP